MPGDVIPYDPQAVTFPAMYPVSGELLLFHMGCDRITFHKTMMAVLQVYAKKIIIQGIADDVHIMAIIHLDATHIFQRRMT